MTAGPPSLETTVFEAIAAACPMAPCAIARSTRLLDTYLDSLTLVSILSRIEIQYGFAFEIDELTEMLRAADIGDLIAVIARKLDSLSK
jgi:acyl carrier protein